MIKLKKWKNYSTNKFAIDRGLDFHYKNVYFYLNQDLRSSGNKLVAICRDGRFNVFAKFLQTSYDSRFNRFDIHPFYR